MVASSLFAQYRMALRSSLFLRPALNETIKNLPAKTRPEAAGQHWLKPVIVAGAVLSVLTLVYCGAKFVSEYHFHHAQNAEDLNAAAALYEQGLRFDPDNGNAHLRSGFTACTTK